MPFRIGLSGLNAAQADLRVTGNNISNVSTIGFKQSRAEFANVYATSKGGSVSTAIGSGVRLAATSQQFTQGNLIFTDNNLDLAITGDGFFSLEDTSGNSVYTRNGQFKVDGDGFVVDNSGSKLQGYGIDKATNEINTGIVSDLQVIATNIAPKPTGNASLIANLDAGAEAFPIPAAGDPTFLMDDNGTVDPNTYAHTTSFTSFDSLGNSMQTSLYFRKVEGDSTTTPETPVTWDVGIKQVDANGNIFNNMGFTSAVGDIPEILEGEIVAPATQLMDAVIFLNNGSIDPTSTDTADGKLNFTFDLSAPVNPVMTADAVPANNPLIVQTLTIDANDLTQYGANFGITNLTQDGYTTGQLSGIEIDQTGVVLARFTNGKSSNLGQIYLTTFTNNQGLSQLGNNYWAESLSSGQGVINIPGSGNAGLINSGANEDSNVDLTAQLINLITAQRNFQANAKTITTANQVTQTLLQI